MAYYFVNTQNTSNTDNATLRLLLAGDAIVFGSAAVWTATGQSGTVLSLSGSNRVTVAGQLYGATGISGGGIGNAITVTATGAIVGVDQGISLGSGTADIFNFGMISGGIGISVQGSGQINNAGTISGETGGIVATLTVALTLQNSGTISGSDALTLSGAETFTLNNSGTILSERFVLFAASVVGATMATRTILNSGTMMGGIYALIGAPLSITNSGTITGALTLGSNDDIVDSATGHLFGAVYGRSGDDVLIGSLEGDRLFGGAGSDDLGGGAGRDVLAGGASGDRLDGGDGDDLASYADAAAGVTVDLADPARATGDATGDVLVSIEGLQGSAYDDSLFGDAGVNRLVGGDGADLLDGRAGADILRGGLGDDRYAVDAANDHVIERAGEGDDTVRSSAPRYTLPDNVERLLLIGTGAIDGTGNALGNAISGGAGANRIDGAGGNDVLTGGGGADVFVFATPRGAGEVDTVTDFAGGTDRMELSRAMFAELGSGAALRANAFVTGAAAQDANDRIIWNTATGDLSYDPDGTGAAAASVFAHLNGTPTVTAADFVLVG